MKEKAVLMENSDIKEWSETEIIPISALSHFLYCERQYALIHIEGIFIHNNLTAGGKIGHEFVDTENELIDHGLRKEMSLRLYSDRLGLSGIADLVEFPDGKPPFPVDYKHGRIASWRNHEAQLCAIALCLEEMLGTDVPEGAIYHLYSKKRHTVAFTPELRMQTMQMIDRIRSLAISQTLPAPQNGRKCRRCSLRPACQPEVQQHSEDHLFVPAELL